MEGSMNEFSVCQFFNDKNYEYVCRYVSAEEAINKFKFYTNNVSSRIGMTKRVILTDGGDCINMEWEYGKGITYPTKEDMQ
jgi:hypothetical protein